VISSRETISLPCPHCAKRVEGDSLAVLVDQWPEAWAKVEGAGLSLEFRLAIVSEASGLSAGCATCGLPTPREDRGMRCRRCGAVTWVHRAGDERVQLGVRVDGTRAGHSFKALVPICQGEQMLRRDAAVGASSESNKSLLGVTAVGCAIAAAVVLVPIVIAIAYGLAKC
jgi:hypothetical protein